MRDGKEAFILRSLALSYIRGVIGNVNCKVSRIHVVKYCQISFGYWSLLFLCSKNSIGVSYYMERKKKETISVCIEKRL